MEISIGDEITYNNKTYIIMEDLEYDNKKYFLLSTTEKPITGVVVEYKIENEKLFINDDIDDNRKAQILLTIAKELKITEKE